MDINDDYKITCELITGKYLYKLFYNNELIYEYIDKYKPNELPRRSGNIKRLMDKINYNIIDETDLKKQKMEDLETIINELKISYKNNELIFDDYQMTNNRVYTKNNNIIFNFCIIKVECMNNIFRILFKNNMGEFALNGNVEDILDELNKRYLVNNSMSNYKFVFNTLISMVIENASK